MFLKRSLPALLMLLILIMPARLLSQVPVEISRQKIVVEGKVYYMHPVQKGQTLYSISRAYQVTVDDITRENEIPYNGIQDGQMLKIPVITNPVVVQENPPAIVKEEARQQNTTQAAGQAPVKAPSATPAAATASTVRPSTQDERFIYHRVDRGETLSSVSREYGISVRELKKANKGLLFPREGDYLMIPREKIPAGHAANQEDFVNGQEELAEEMTDTLDVSEESEVFTVAAEKTVLTELEGSVRVAVMLPFFLEENSVRSYIDSTKKDSKGNKIYREVNLPGEWIYEGSLPFLETYEGILIALDSLRALGLKVELDAFDTGADTSEVKSLISSGRLEGMDLIIGPVYSSNLGIISSWATEYSVPVVSPVPLRDQNILENRPTLFRVYPSANVAQDISVEELRLHRGSNIIFLYSDTLMSDPRTFDYWRKISSAMEPVSLDDSTIITPHYFTGLIPKNDTYSGVTSFETLLNPYRENIIVLAISQTPKVSSAFSTLHTLSRKYSIKVIGYPEIGSLETIDLRYYYDLELFIPSESYIDFNRQAATEFITSFRKKFGTEPMAESFAWRGFDIAFYFIGGIASHGNAFLNDPGIFNPDLLCLDPMFRRNSRSEGYENRGMYILHYKKDMTIEVITPWNQAH
jgi:LysM repeat protein